MMPFRQLLRQPVRAATALILLTAAAASICLGWGVLRSAQATAGAISGEFVNLSLISPQYGTTHRQTLTLDPATGEYFLSSVGEEYLTVREVAEKDNYEMTYGGKITDILVDDFLNTVEESPYLRGVYQQQFLSACVPGVRSVSNLNIFNQQTQNGDIPPYNRGIILFKPTSLMKNWETTRLPGEVGTDVGSCMSYLEGDIVETLAIYPDLTPRNHIRVFLRFDSQEVFDSFNESLMPGKTYILRLDNYIDYDLYLRSLIIVRTTLGAEDRTPDDIDLSLLTPETDPGFPGEMGYRYTDPLTGVSTTFHASEVDGCIDHCTASADRAWFQVIPEGQSLEDFLADPENAGWVDLLQALDCQYESFSVLGTDLLDSLYLFHENIATVVEGRGFDSADYADGNRVCLISQTLAQANGLHVGDKLDLSLYNGVFDLPDPIQIGVNTQFLDSLEQIQDTREYEIVGVYRNAKEWEPLSLQPVTSYNFNPNTIFVPNASLAGLETYQHDDINSGDINKLLLRSYVFQNGAEENMEALFAEKGWPTDLLVYFDGGYSAIKEAMVGFMDSPRQLFVLAVATFLVILTVYVVLFVMKQRRNAGLMLSLGAGKGRAGWFVFSVSAIPAVISCVLGAALGAVLLRGAVTRVLGDSVAYVKDYLDFSPNAVFVAAAVMAGVEIAVLGVVSIVLSRRKAASLMKK